MKFYFSISYTERSKIVDCAAPSKIGDSKDVGESKIMTMFSECIFNLRFWE